MMVETVNRKPWLPASIAVFRLMPNPKPTMEYCNNFLTKESVSKTFPKILTNKIPKSKAMGGELNDENEKTANAKNRILRNRLFLGMFTEFSFAKIFKTKYSFCNFSYTRNLYKKIVLLKI